MAMWPGANPVVSMWRYNADVLKQKYGFFNPRIDLSDTSPVVAVSFPQFEGESNLDPELFQMQGQQIRISVAFKLIDAGATDMSLGSPGSINTIEEQIQHLLADMMTGKMKDEFRVYIPDWGYDGADYLITLLEEISISQGDPMLAEGTARFVWGGNPLA